MTNAAQPGYVVLMFFKSTALKSGFCGWKGYFIYVFNLRPFCSAYFCPYYGCFLFSVNEMCFYNRLIPYNPDCRRYVHCESSSWSLMRCPDCLYFSSKSNVCEYPEDVLDCQDPIPVTTTTTASPTGSTECTAPARPRASTEPQDCEFSLRLFDFNMTHRNLVQSGQVNVLPVPHI